VKTATTVTSILVALAFLGWLGLQIKPSPFPAFPEQRPELATIPLPESLPEPVAHFCRQIYGETVPVIRSAVITGRATIRINGIRFQARYRFVHDAGQGYRHYIEACFFGLPLFKVNEHYLEGKSWLELPVGMSEGPKVDQGANLALWAESAVWLPSVLITKSSTEWKNKYETRHQACRNAIQWKRVGVARL
jgi:uncharacterized protein DUF6544